MALVAICGCLNSEHSMPIDDENDEECDILGNTRKYTMQYHFEQFQISQWKKEVAAQKC